MDETATRMTDTPARAPYPDPKEDELMDDTPSALSRIDTPPTARREPRVATTGFQVIALGALAVALIMAFVSANSIVDIWFENRYVPIVRLVFALIVGGIAIWVILKMAEKKA